MRLRAVGVPAIWPVAVLKARPGGRAGVIAQLVAAPPLLVGLIGETTEPKMNTSLLGL